MQWSKACNVSTRPSSIEEQGSSCSSGCAERPIPWRSERHATGRQPVDPTWWMSGRSSTPIDLLSSRFSSAAAAGGAQREGLFGEKGEGGRAGSGSSRRVAGGSGPPQNHGPAPRQAA